MQKREQRKKRRHQRQIKLPLKLTIRLKVNNYRKESVDHKEKMEVTAIPTVIIKYELEKDVSDVSDVQGNDKQIRRCFVCYCKFHSVTGQEGQR